ncbi:MAG: GNAT family N-acetyltransferase [Desulfobacteraceae bacterium]|nr:MAG: GNAT family N-acetyltransferase [Desulfobacteraceae bacterium]
MATAKYWPDNYIEKKKSVSEALSLIRPGQRIFISSSCGEPQYLVRELSRAASNFTDIEIVRLLSLETIPLTMIATQTKSQNLNIRSFYSGSAASKELAKNIRFITPINLSAIPGLFKTGRLPIHVALIQVTPPDDFGWMSLGVSVDVSQAAAAAADIVIAQVNEKMPRVLGRSFIHVDDVDVIVEHNEDILSIKDYPELASDEKIARHIARLVDDGSTIQISLGATPNATLLALANKNDLGVHTYFLTDGIMNLFSRGVITNRKKGFNDGKIVASSAVGTRALYDFMDNNPAIEFHPSDYVNSPSIISRHNKMVSMNIAMAMDLTGQAAVDALPYNLFSGVTGMLDFVRGASESTGGKSILMLAATGLHGKKSRIVPMISDMAVVIPRSDVQYVVTEYGSVNLAGKSIQERAMAMISIAHPDFRDELFDQAKKRGLLGPERTLTESIHGIYPIALEEVLTIDYESVTIRPAKPVDERRIQEHFYNLDKDDIIARFFHKKTSFVHDEVEGISQIDYINDLTILAVVGEIGFGKVVAIGECLLNQSDNMAEVAFSVSKPYQGKGLGRVILKKLTDSARENGISGLFAYTSPQNRGMINLFKTLPYKVKILLEDDMLHLSCKFEDPVS